MTNIDIARDLIFQASERLTAARAARRRKNYAFTVRLSQECVELATKAALIFAGVEVPRWHDVGPVLQRERKRFPPGFKRTISRIAVISRILRREREPSMYGDETTGLSPGDLYDAYSADETLTDAAWVLRHCKRLVEK